MKLKDNTELVSATNVHGREIEIACSSFMDATIWVYSSDFGPSLVVVADTFDDAYETMLDASPTVPQDELHEAYGLSSDQWSSDAGASCSDFPDLIEGYHYQPNASDTGVVAVGHYEHLAPWTRKSGLDLKIQKSE
jgi:hypothetical protein